MQKNIFITLFLILLLPVTVLAKTIETPINSVILNPRPGSVKLSLKNLAVDLTVTCTMESADQDQSEVWINVYGIKKYKIDDGKEQLSQNVRLPTDGPHTVQLQGIENTWDNYLLIRNLDDANLVFISNCFATSSDDNLRK